MGIQSLLEDKAEGFITTCTTKDGKEKVFVENSDIPDELPKLENFIKEKEEKKAMELESQKKMNERKSISPLKKIKIEEIKDVEMKDAENKTTTEA